MRSLLRKNFGLATMVALLGLFPVCLFAQQLEWDEAKAVENLPPNTEGHYERFVEKDKMGYRAADGRVVVPPKYDYLPPSAQSFMLVRQDGAYGVINHLGKVLVPFGLYERLTLEQGYQLGETNQEGVVQVPEMDKIGLLAQKAGYVGLINPLGKVVVPLEYEIGKFAGEQQYLFFKEGKWWLWNSSGQKQLPEGFDYAQRVPGGLILAKEGKEGFWMPPNEWVLPLQYDEIRPDPHYPTLQVTRGGITRQFTPRTRLFSEYTGPASRTLDTLPIRGQRAPYFMLRHRGRDRYGLGHVERGTLLKPVYSYVFPLADFRFFSGTLDGKVALFDSLGRQKTPFLYQILADVSGNPSLLIAQKGSEQFLLRLQDGQLASKTGYSKIFELKNGCFSASDGNLLAFINEEGERLTQHKYASIVAPSSDQQEWAAQQKPPRQLRAVATLESLKQRGLDAQGNEFDLNE